MKNLILSAIATISVLFATNAKADEPVRFDAKNGMSIVVPGETEIKTNDDETIELEHDAFYFMAIAFDSNAESEDAVSKSLVELAQTIKIDLDNAQQDNYELDDFAGYYMASYIENTEYVSYCGVVYSKKVENLGYLYFIIGENADAAAATLNSMEQAK